MSEERSRGCSWLQKHSGINRVGSGVLEQFGLESRIMGTRKDSEALRRARVRNLWECWKPRQSQMLSGMANLDVRKFRGWMLEHYPQLLPVGRDPYHSLKLDLEGLITTDMK